ncbi:hypothetical protein HQ520_13960 [bacterium]|nr:hypothetical protein [bacterium]
MAIALDTSSWAPDVASETDYQVEETERPLWDGRAQSISDFQPASTESPEEWGSIQRRLQRGFVELLRRRQKYLSDLQNLQPGWISGGGEVPSADVLKEATDLLRFFENGANTRLFETIPRLVIGPLPSGGIGIELHAEQDSAVFVTFLNHGRVEIDLKYRGYYYYTSFDSDLLSLGAKVLAKYESISDL